jgi:outer membrane protein assembly complex protein YaeT
VRRIVAGRVSAFFASRHIDVKVVDLRYNLLRASMTMREVRVHPTAWRNAHALLTIGRAHIDISLPELLRGRYVVQTAGLEEVDFSYFVDEHGSHEAPPSTTPERDSVTNSIEYFVSSFSVVNARVRYKNGAQRIDAQLPISSIEIFGNDFTRRHQIRFVATGGEIQVRGHPVAIDRLDGHIDAGRDDLAIERIGIDSHGSHVELTGAVAPFSAPVLTAELSASPLQFRDLRDAQLGATFVVDIPSGSANVSALHVRAPWGVMDAKGSVAFNQSGRSILTADVRHVDAATLMRSLRLPYAAAAEINAMLQAEWPGLDYRQATGSADVNLHRPASAISQPAVPVTGRVLGHADNGRIDAELVQIAVPGAEVNGRVAVTSDRQLQGTVRTRSGDVGQLLSSLESLTGRPAGSLQPLTIAGPAAIDAHLAGSVGAPVATTTVAVPALELGTASGIALNAAASIAGRSVTINEGEVIWNQARVRLDGYLGIGADEPIELSLAADDLTVQSLLEAMNQPHVPLSGTLSAAATVRGTVARPDAVITTTGSNLVAYGEKVGSLSGTIRLDNNVLTSDLAFDKPQPDLPGRVSANGTFDISRQTYTFDLESSGLQLLGVMLPDGQRLRADVPRLAARGSGSLVSPEGTIDLDVSAIEIAKPGQPFSSESGLTNASDLGRVALNAVAKDGEATITVTAEQLNIDARATIGLSRPWPSRLMLRAIDSDLTAIPLQTIFPVERAALAGLQGQLRATVEASGDLTAPAQGLATVTLESLCGTWNGRPFAMTSPSPLQYADKRLTIDTLRVDGLDSSLTISGDLPVADASAPGRILVDLRGSLAAIAQYAPADANISADGAVTLTGSLRGTLEHIEPDLALTIDNGLVLSPRLRPGLSNVALRARIQNGAADIEQFDASWGTATVQLSGWVPLDVLPEELPVDISRSGGPSTVTASVTGLDPSSIPGMPARVRGRISAEARLSAPRADLEALGGYISFSEFDVSFDRLTLMQQQPAKLTIGSGIVTVDELGLSGTAGTIRTGGRIALDGEPTLDLNVNGTLNIAALSFLTNRLRADGDSAVNILVSGPLTAPKLTGTVDVMDGTAVISEPNIAVDRLNARLDLSGRRISVTRLDADVNGGSVSASGAVTLGERFVDDVDLEITATQVAYDAPLDLRSLSNTTIRVTRNGDTILVKGKATMEEGGLTNDIHLDAGFLARIGTRRDRNLIEVRHPLLERVRFDIEVATATPVLVDNNLARAEIEADLHIVGTPYETGLLGTLTLRQESEVLLNERRYRVERGVITFADERRIVPAFDLRLNTTTGGYDITVVVTGTAGNTETTLTSIPSRPEPDLLAMLLTGRTLDEMRGKELDVARDQVLSSLAGRVGATLGRGLREATGFSEVRIEPILIANEADPTARLTIGQNLTNNLRIVYSTNLAHSNDQIWVIEYDFTRRFRARAVWQEDGSHRFDFRRDARFGGQPESRAGERVRPRVAMVSVTVDGGNETAVRNAFGIRTGDTYDFFAARTGVQRVEDSLIEQGYLQSRVRLDREIANNQARLQLHVLTGPHVEIVTMGVTPPRRVEHAIRQDWQKGAFDRQRADDSVETLRGWLMDNNYLQAQIEYDIEEVTDGQRRVVFHIQPGARARRIVLAFEGASAIHAGELNRLIEAQRLERQLLTDPSVVVDTLQRFYQARGYLSAHIDEPQLQFEGDTARLLLRIEEGGLFTVGAIVTSGNTIYGSAFLISQLPLIAGQPFIPASVENALEKIRELYRSKGYNDVQVEYEPAIDPVDREVHIAFTITEGRQSVLAGISVTGTERVSDHLVQAQMQLSAGEPLDLGSLARSRRNLYGTGAFSLVDITRRELADDVDRQTAVHLDVAVTEAPPFQLRYGASYDTERSLGVILDLSNRNSLGGARELGIQSRYDSQLRDVRFYINQPALTYRHETTWSMYFRQELNPPTELSDPFDTSRKGVSVQQQRTLRQGYRWTYGYKYERARTLTPTPIGIVDDTIGISPLTSTLARDTRDVVYDASKGSFFSQALSFSPSWLGSEQPFAKYFGQYFHYFPLQAERQNPITNVTTRPRLVFASAVRLGLAWGLDGDVPRTERFFAGGSATLRGFEQNTVGPITPERFAVGGEALLVLNNEIRVPLIGALDGVFFTDIGNVFGKVRNFSLMNLRQSAGVGLRIRTSWLLLRGDYGVVLDPRPGEDRGQFYFSVGQAF